MTLLKQTALSLFYALPYALTLLALSLLMGFSGGYITFIPVTTFYLFLFVCIFSFYRNQRKLRLIQFRLGAWIIIFILSALYNIYALFFIGLDLSTYILALLKMDATILPTTILFFISLLKVRKLVKDLKSQTPTSLSALSTR